MTTFLKLELYVGTDHPPAYVLVNIDHVLRIYPTWPENTSNVIMNEEGPGIHVKASFEDITQRLIATGGRVVVKTLES